MLKRILSIKSWKINRKKFIDLWDYDLKFNASFRGKSSLDRSDLRMPELKIIKLYRKCQAQKGTVWYLPLYWRLKRVGQKTGMCLYQNMNIGKGLIIGHAGTIVLNVDVVFGNNIYLTHGVTIGRDIRGRRKGTPVIGDNVCIRAYSSIVGKITIGNDVLIAPNSFVNFDVPDHSVVLGNPGSIHHRDWATEGHLGTVDV